MEKWLDEGRAVLRFERVDGAYNIDNQINPFLEIDIIAEGELVITVNGRTWTAVAGDIVVIPPLALRSHRTPERVKMAVCRTSYIFRRGLIDDDDFTARRTTVVFKPSRPLSAFLSEIGFYSSRSVSGVNEQRDRETIIRMRAALHLILSEFIIACPVTATVGTDNTLAQILIFLSFHYTEQVTLETVAEELGLSPKYVSNCFAQIPGVSFRSFINALRIDEAKARLSTTDDPVMTVAHLCGFRNESSFHRIFRDHTGLTPTEYRESVGK